MIKPEERYKWISDYLTDLGRGQWVDVLDASFVDEYAAFTGATIHYTPYGANRVPQLGRDLKAMYDQYLLKRSRAGIEGMAGMGFPKWVWAYQLSGVTS